MRCGIRYLCLVGASALLLVGPAADPQAVFGTTDSLAQGKSEGKGGDRGKSSASRGRSDGKAGDRGKSGQNPNAYASKGKNSTTGAHQMARDLGMSMGEFSSWVKSWRSAYRGSRAFEATMDNPNSLAGRQYAYADAFVALSAAQLAYDQAIAACASAADCIAQVEANQGAALTEAQTSAETAFLATLPESQATYDPALRKAIDDIVVQIGLAGADAGLF